MVLVRIAALVALGCAACGSSTGFDDGPESYVDESLPFEVASDHFPVVAAFEFP